MSVTAPPPDLEHAPRDTRWAHTYNAARNLDLVARNLFTPLPAWDGAEGDRYRIQVAPGMIAVTSTDAARAERTHERARRARNAAVDLLTTDLLLEHRREDAVETEQAVHAAAAALADYRLAEAATEWVEHLERRIESRDAEDSTPAARVTSWSRKSRARMVRRLAELDYEPMFVAGRAPVMLTLTYPGDWLAVAPDAPTCKRHLDALKKRYARAWGSALVAIWKREFQRRGAPHYHLLVVPPEGHANGLNFREWVGRTWADVVGHQDPEERRRHALAGTNLSYVEGARMTDPKRLAIYFSKHGAYAAKEYQNHAPAAWTDGGASVGRFWGYWGLELATVEVEVTPVEALAAARTMRRWQNANGYRVQTTVQRRRVDPSTGELRHHRRCDREGCDGRCWTRRSGSWSGSRMRGHRGFVIVNDGAGFATQLSRYLDQVRPDPSPEDLRSDPASSTRRPGNLAACVACGGRVDPGLSGRRHLGDCVDLFTVEEPAPRPASCGCGHC